MVSPNLVTKNQYGEVQNQFIQGGSNQIDINFIVDATNGNGLGIRSLKGSPLVSAVFMHTSATALAGNPNPAVGFVIVKLAAPYQSYITGFNGNAAPVSGTPINISSGLTAHNVYVITSLGTSTLANWTAIGWLGSALPTVGATFVASTSSAGVGTGIVEASSVSGVLVAEIVGDPNQTINLSGGGYIVVQLLGPTSTSNPTPIPVAPAAGSVIGMRLILGSATPPTPLY